MKASYLPRCPCTRAIVSVPLRGRGDESTSHKDNLTGRYGKFQSPCGEEVMKGTGDFSLNLTEQKGFQSPCGEEVMKA